MRSEKTLLFLKENLPEILIVLNKEPSPFAREILLTAIADDAAEAVSEEAAKRRFSKDLKKLHG